MGHSIRLTCACIVVFLASVCPSRGALVLSLDGSRTGDGGTGTGDCFLTAPAMSQATQILINRGYTIATRSLFTAANIAGAGALFTGFVDTAFTSQEITDIKNFVSAGGGLVIVRDFDGFYPAADPLAAAFGVVYDTTGVGIAGTPTPVNKTAEHPIWSGPAGSVTSFSEIFASDVASGGTAIGVHSTNPTKVGLAVTTFGAGRVVFLTDNSGWRDSNGLMTPATSNNAIVWANMFAWAVVPEPGGFTLVVVTMSGLLGARRHRRQLRI
jgi:hypothetical protein